MSQIPEGSIVITPTEVYNEVKSLTDVVRVLVAQDHAESTARAELRAEVKQLRADVDAINKKLFMASGAAAALGAGFGSWLPTLLGR